MRLPWRAVVVSAGLVLATGGGLAARTALADLPPRRAVLSIESFAFSPQTLEVAAGSVEVTVANTDAVAHTFTVTELHVDLEVAGSGAKSIAFDAPSGTYAFECAIPGHTGPGMRGTLEVRG